MSYIKTLCPLFNTGLAKEDRKLSQHDIKIVDCEIKNQHKT